MKNVVLLTDGSVNTKSSIGYGAYLALSEPLPDVNQVTKEIKLRRFEQTSSSKLELQTLLWALTEIPAGTSKVVVYTDSQTIVRLKDRRKQLEQNDYHSGKGVPLKNAALYREFFRMTDQLDCEFVKVKGHQPGNQKVQIDMFFAMVDHAARKALRE